jgi:hypothetical protein
MFFTARLDGHLELSNLMRFELMKVFTGAQSRKAELHRRLELGRRRLTD